MVMNGYLFPKEKCCRTTKIAKLIQRSHVINLGCLKHSSNPPISMGGLMTYHQDGVRDLGSNMFSSVFPFAIGTAAKESWSRLFRPLDCLNNGECFQLIVFRMEEHHVQKILKSTSSDRSEKRDRTPASLNSISLNLRFLTIAIIFPCACYNVFMGCLFTICCVWWASAVEAPSQWHHMLLFKIDKTVRTSKTNDQCRSLFFLQLFFVGFVIANLATLGSHMMNPKWRACTSCL